MPTYAHWLKHRSKKSTVPSPSACVSFTIAKSPFIVTSRLLVAAAIDTLAVMAMPTGTLKKQVLSSVHLETRKLGAKSQCHVKLGTNVPLISTKC